MSIKALVVPRLAAAITSPRLRRAKWRLADWRRRLARRPRAARAYLRAGDPYSHVLAGVLESIAERFDIEVQVRAVATLPAEMSPDPARLAAWARRDAALLADLYELAPPGPEREADEIVTANLRLAELTSGGGTAARPASVWSHFENFASGAPITSPDDRAAAEAVLRANERALEKDGHYASGMIDYGGEWYWGIDRLNHLEARLIADGLARSSDEAPRFTRRLRSDALSAPAGGASPALVLYWSARSPYSYLVLDRAIALARDAGAALDVRPVLPMVMRNLAVPRAKRFYILLDAKREADLLGLPFGRVCDPLGRGVERCYAIFDVARESGREVSWVREFSRAVWSEGVDAASDGGIRQIAERAGLDPDRCIERVGDDGWRLWAERHRLEMEAGGFWGVPTLRFGDTWVWGQDRLWVIEAAMRRAAGAASTRPDR